MLCCPVLLVNTYYTVGEVHCVMWDCAVRVCVCVHGEKKEERDGVLCICASSEEVILWSGE